jgi:type I restriction enzyme S subunit
MSGLNWTTARLGEVTELVGGGTPARTEAAFFGADIDWVTPSDLSPIGEVRTLGDVAEKLSRKGLANSSAKELPPGTVLFSSRASIGKIAVTDRRCCTNQGFANFIACSDKLDPWYLAYFLAMKIPEIEALAGTTTFKEVSRRKLRDFPITFPSLPEQRRIVLHIQECMERIDEIRMLRRETRRESRAIFRSTVCETYTALLNTVRPAPLGKLAAAIGGGTPDRRHPEYWNGVIPWVSPKDMKVFQLEDSEEHISEEGLRASAAKLIQSPAVLFVVRGMILAHTLPVAVTQVPVAINQDMKALQAKPGCRTEFLAYMVRGAESQLLGKVEIAGHGTRRLQTKHWMVTPIPVPSLKKQDNIVKFLRRAEACCAEAVSIVDGTDVKALGAAVLRMAFSDEL